MRTSPIVRLFLMGMILVGLCVPLAMTRGVVAERTSRRDDVANEIARDWAGVQSIAGPVLSVPYRYSWTDANGRKLTATARHYVLPDSLAIDGTLETQVRKRSIFGVPVYTASLKMRGSFRPPKLRDVQPPPDEVLWEEATLHLGVADPRGIARSVDVTWNGQARGFVPASAGAGIFESGVQAPADGLGPDRAESIDFALQLDVKGTREIRLVPTAGETTATLASSWPHPSFVGRTPELPRLGAGGFQASWRVPSFGRGFPSEWTGNEPATAQKLQVQAQAAAFGVGLIQPVDIYVQADRAVKYAVLVILVTFVMAFLWEITSGVLLHPVQYIFVGFALCIFYLLLLSLAEHRGFDQAYVIAASGTIALLAWYWSSVLRRWTQGVLMAGALSVLYGCLYLLLRLEDYALVAGSIGVFAMLAIVMFLTRRVDWYQLKLGDVKKAQ
jgi:inner membrane protein